ncbi:MAG: ATP-dependent helicase [Desulfobacterales bacterium]
MQISYEKELNPRQIEAVTHLEGPLLVIAGAGSGKTRTLTYRAARLVESGVSPASILLLTFTRKAAEEMLKRASALLDARCRQIAGGTFHSFANSVLRRFGRRIGFDPGFVIIDRPDAENLIGMIVKDAGIRPAYGSFPKKKTLMDIFSKAANKSKSLEETLMGDYAHFRHLSTVIAELHATYQNVKREQRFMDYDDLLINLRDLLDQDEEVRRTLHDQYRYVMVDEYQDTNPVQAEIVRLATGPHRNVMVVGDDSQSIYSFRGANFRNIMDFPRLFPGTHIIKLEENYRSTPPILSVTNAIIDQAEEKFPKKLFSKQPGGSRPSLVHAGTENSQSRFVVDKVRELQREGVPLDDIAVLFRAGFHSFDLEVELAREGIPFVKYGGFKFTESAHIKDMIAHLRVLLNPNDRLSWLRILLLINKVGPTSAQRIYEAVVAQNAGYKGLVTAKTRGNIPAGVSLLKDLFAGIDYPEMSPIRIGERIFEYYLPLLKTHHDDHPKRARDLEQLLLLLERYDNLEDFLADMAIEPPTASQENRLSVDAEAGSRLILSTVHSAKGLEWHTVMVLWALDGRFPSQYAMETREQLDEELRLMYVAATRARENLYFLCPGQFYDRTTGTYLSRPSRFLEMISEELLAREAGDIW